MMHAVDWSDTLVAAAGGEPGKVCRGRGWSGVRNLRNELWLIIVLIGRYEE